jgi:hypothetical protein
VDAEQRRRLRRYELGESVSALLCCDQRRSESRLRLGMVFDAQQTMQHHRRIGVKTTGKCESLGLFFFFAKTDFLRLHFHRIPCLEVAWKQILLRF